MGLIKRLLVLVLAFLGFVALVLSLLFMFGDRFVPGHIPSLMLSAYPHYWMMSLAVLLVICIVWLVLRGTTAAKVVFAMVAVSFAVSGVAIYQMIDVCNKAGAKVDFFASFNPWDVSEVQSSDAIYAQGMNGDLALSVFYLEDGKTDKPVVFYTHGGGWVIGNRFEREFDCKVLALLGYVTVSWDYDLSDYENHLWDKVEYQELEALTWVRDNVAAFGGTTDRFYMMGDSAGGQLTLDVAYKVSSGLVAGSDGAPLPEIDAVCCDYPVASPTAFWDYNGTLSDSNGRSMVERYIGGTPEEQPMRAAAIEPSYYITSDAPPTFMMVAAEDSLVPSAAALTLAEQLKAAGVEAEVVSVPHANHLFDLVDGSIGDQAYVYFLVHWVETHQ